MDESQNYRSSYEDYNSYVRSKNNKSIFNHSKRRIGNYDPYS